jgi:glycosyltransferase involved in cell wall biosynthesis
VVEERFAPAGNGRPAVWMLIGSYWPAPEGGAEKQCRALTHALRRRGLECTVITTRLRYAGGATADDQGVVIRRLGLLCPLAVSARRGLQALRAVALRPFGANAAAAERVWSALEFWLLLPLVWLARLDFLAEALFALRPGAGEVSVLHVHESSWLAGLGVWLARRRRVPVVCKEATFPALAPLGYDTPFRARLDRQRRLASFIVMTQEVLDSARERGIPPERLHLIPNGVALPAGAPTRSASAPVLYVGNFSQGAQWKAFDVLFDGWALVHRLEPGARLTAVGGGDRTAWEQLLRHHGAEPSVRFAGRVEDPAPFYREAAIFVLPSRIEGLSNALLEAQSWGLPAVVSDIPGNRAAVEDGVNGIVVPVGDAEALAGAVVRLLRDPGLRARMGRAARERVRRQFSIEAVADQVVALYRQLASLPGAQPVAHRRPPA